MPIRPLIAAALELVGLVVVIMVATYEWGGVGFGVSFGVALVVIGVLIDQPAEGPPGRRGRFRGVDLPPGS